MAQSKYLKQDGELIYPVTTTGNVFDSSGVPISETITSDEFKTNAQIPANTAYLPNNILMKWGTVVGSGSGNQRINFSSPFPNACVLVLCGACDIGTVTRLYGSYGTSSGWDKNGFYASIIAVNAPNNETYYSTGKISYIAIGY